MNPKPQSQTPYGSPGFTFDDIGNRETATVNGRVSTYAPTALNQYAQRTVPSSVEVLGTAHPDATVTVNMEPTTRQGERFVGTVAVDNAPAAVWAEARIVGVRNLQGPQGEDAVTEETRRLLVPRSPEIFAHDLDGNLTGDGRWSYVWDGENRLVAMETPAALVDPAGPLPLAERRRLEFAYDAAGRRLSKKVYSWDGAAWTLATHRVFLYDGWNMAAEYRVAPDGLSLTLERSATWGVDLSGSMQGAGGVGGLLWIGDATATFAAAFDGNGNVTALVDTATGTIGGDFEYGPFGEPLKASGPAASVSPFRFSTKYTDVETALVLYGFRYYNPSTGRWINRDPIAERGGVNLYGMVNNDSVNLFDVLGFYPGVQGHGTAITPGESLDLVTRLQTESDRLQAAQDGRTGDRLNYIMPLFGNPTGDGRLNTNSQNRFVFTCKYGWIDMGHFFRNANGAFRLGKVVTATAAGSVEMGQYTLGRRLLTHGLPPVWTPRKVREAIDKRFSSRSGYAVEDLMSNARGRDFGAGIRGDYESNPSAATHPDIAAAWQKFLRDAGAVKVDAEAQALIDKDIADYGKLYPWPTAATAQGGLDWQKAQNLWKCLCNENGEPKNASHKY